MAAILASGANVNVVADAARVTTLSAFSGVNGALPYAGLHLANDGNFYGTTFQGGVNGPPFGLGTVFRLTPSGVMTTLISFSNATGTRPLAALAQGADGYLYGTTSQGGDSNSGTLFRISTNGSFTALLSFTNTNGARPSARLTLAHDGHFYGSTQLGGTNSQGTLFRVATNGLLTTLVSFNGTNGANPYAEMIQGDDGHFYGTTVNGGNSDSGLVFRLTTNGTLTTLHQFNITDGADPYGGLVQGVSGVLYGTTAYGGQNGYGTVFRITTNGTLTTLYTFTGGNDGANPWASLIQGSDDSLYGTTILGGTTTTAGAWGTVFQIAIDGDFASLASFSFSTNGVSPYASLVQDGGGDLLGTTYSGGSGLKGTIFRITPAIQMLEASLGSGNKFQVAWDAWLGKVYQLQYRTNASLGDWLDFGLPLVATNSPMVIESSTGDPSRLFRVKMIVSP